MLANDPEEKSLVDNYKVVNKQLRSQLDTLNQEIDKLIAESINKFGLKKNTAKNLLHKTNRKTLQLQLESLKKRLQLLQRDNETYKQKMKINYLQKNIILQETLKSKISEKDQCDKKLKQHQKKMSLRPENQFLTANFSAEEQQKLFLRIQQKNQELLHYKKIEKELQKTINYKITEENKKNEKIKTAELEYQDILKKSTLVVDKQLRQVKQTFDEEGWKKIKKEFLELKDSKQKEEIQLNEQNEQLRHQIKQMQQKIKQNKSKIENIKTLEVRRKQRNYSTLDHSAEQEEGFRYRNKNNIFKHSAKN